MEDGHIHGLGPELVFDDEYGRFARSLNFTRQMYAAEPNKASGTLPCWYGKWRRDGLWRDREFSIGIVTHNGSGEIELAVVPWLFFQQTCGSAHFRKLEAAMSKAGWELAKYGSYDWQNSMIGLRFEILS